MNARTLSVLLLLGLLALFSIANWGVIVTPTRLSLLVTHVEAPLGLVLLGFVAVLAAGFLGYAMVLQAGALAASRRHADELRRQRELAEQAEASRFTALREHLDRELAALREELAAAANGLAAAIGEMDERLERQWPTPPERLP